MFETGFGFNSFSKYPVYRETDLLLSFSLSHEQIIKQIYKSIKAVYAKVHHTTDPGPHTLNTLQNKHCSAETEDITFKTWGDLERKAKLSF